MLPEISKYQRKSPHMDRKVCRIQVPEFGTAFQTNQSEQLTSCSQIFGKLIKSGFGIKGGVEKLDGIENRKQKSRYFK